MNEARQGYYANSRSTDHSISIYLLFIEATSRRPCNISLPQVSTKKHVVCGLVLVPPSQGNLVDQQQFDGLTGSTSHIAGHQCGIAHRWPTWLVNIDRSPVDRYFGWTFPVSLPLL